MKTPSEQQRIGELISQKRKGKSITQTNLGALLNLGMQAISDYEKGKVKVIPFEKRVKLAEILDIPIIELLYEAEKAKGIDSLIAVTKVVEKRAAANATAAPGDYEKGGLLYCGKCNTPKQHRGEFLGIVKIVPCICQCRAAELAAEEQQRQREKLQERIKKHRLAGFPESDMQHWTFSADDGADPRIMRAAKNYVANFGQFREQGKGLLLYGGVGTGKTFAAACIVNALIDTGRPCLMTNFARVLNTLWSIEEKQAYIDSFNKFDLLVLDDLGTERRSEYAQEQVFNVIDSRYRAKLPLIITTNLSIEEIKKPDSVGNSRIYDRVLEMCHPVEVTGKSRRRQKVAAEFKGMNELLGL